MIDSRDEEYLLNLARQTLLWHLKYGEIPNPVKAERYKNVSQKLGCFVSLYHKTKGLRGCIGTFERIQPLIENVISLAVEASGDSRFRAKPVTYEELKDIIIEISIPTEPQVLLFKSPEDLLSKLRPLVDGVILYTRYGNSTYLPQVWEHFLKKEDFFSNLCQKHGSPDDIWRKDYKNVSVRTYQAQIFREKLSERYVVGPKGAVVGEKGAMVLGAVTPLEDGIEYGGGPLKKGTQLAPGAIVTWDSDIIEKP